MKILHTSDWHLGQHFMMKSREAEHNAFCEWLINVIDEHLIDVVIIAGDIFDTASPPSYARKLYGDFIVKLQSTKCKQLIVVSGNHDSVAVLNESKNLLASLNVTVIAGLSDDLNDHIIEIGSSTTQSITVCALPFLRATDVMRSESGSSSNDKQMSLQQGILDTYQQIYQLAKDKQLCQPNPIIATGHLTAVGCSVSESVRDIYIGTLTAFPASLFPAFDYIALGHLHRAQKVQKSEHIRYSGSPLPLSFDEANNEKSIIIAEFNESGKLATTQLSIPRFQLLTVIKGEFSQVKAELTLLIERGESVWVEVKIDQSLYSSEIQTQLNELVADSGVQILKISMAKIDENSQLQVDQVESLDQLKPDELFQYRLDCADADDISTEQRKELKRLFAQSVAELEQLS